MEQSKKMAKKKQPMIDWWLLLVGYKSKHNAYMNLPFHKEFLSSTNGKPPTIDRTMCVLRFIYEKYIRTHTHRNKHIVSKKIQVQFISSILKATGTPNHHLFATEVTGDYLISQIFRQASISISHIQPCPCAWFEMWLGSAGWE